MVDIISDIKARSGSYVTVIWGYRCYGRWCCYYINNYEHLLSVDIIIISKKVINGERVTQKANSQRLDNKNFNLLLKNLGWNYSKVDSIRNMLQRIKCNTIRTVDYKYFDIEIYNSSNLSYSYLHLKHSIEYHNIKTISNNSKYGNLFSISVTNSL